MAGDWIKIEAATPDKPEIFEIADELKIEPDAVVGKLIRIWGWFDSHTTNGIASVTILALLDRCVGVPGFCDAMEKCGWLRRTGKNRETLTLPNFDYHNSQTAKRRALTQKRVRSHRAKSNDPSVTSSVTSALPEKRREEKSTDTLNAREESHSMPLVKIENALAFGETAGIPPDVVKTWHDDADACGWLDARGRAIRRWQPALNAFWRRWQANENKNRKSAKSDKSNINEKHGNTSDWLRPG